MDSKTLIETPTEKMADLTAVGLEEQSSKVDSLQLARLRRKKIQEHLAVTLELPASLQACMGAITCDLLDMCQDLKSAIDEQRGQGSSLTDHWTNLTPAIETYLKVVRQVDRLAQLDCRINELHD